MCVCVCVCVFSYLGNDEIASGAADSFVSLARDEKMGVRDDCGARAVNGIIVGKGDGDWLSSLAKTSLCSVYKLDVFVL